MVAQYADLTKLRHAKMIAKEGGCFIVEKGGYDNKEFLRMTRDEQHSVVIHAEDNALRQTHDAESVAGYTLYVSPLFPCDKCADKIAKAGIRRVVAYCGHISPDWRASAEAAEQVFINAGVECLFMFEGA